MLMYTRQSSATNIIEYLQGSEMAEVYKLSISIIELSID